MYFGTDLSVDEFLAELNVNADPNKPPIIPFLQANSECLTADVGQLEAHPFPVTMINYAAIGGDDDPDGEYLGPGTLISCTYHVSYSENDGGTGLTYAHERHCMDPDQYNIDEYCMLTDCDEQDGTYPKESDLFWWDWNVLPGDIDKVLGCTTAGQTHYTIGTEACVPYPPTPVALSGDLDIHFSGANGELVDVGLLGQIIADDSECVAGAPCRPKLKMHFVSPQTSFLLFNKKLVTTTAVSASGVEVTQTESGVVESTAGGPLHMSNVNLQIEATKLSIGGEGLLSPPPYNTQFDSVLVAMNPTTCELKLTSTATVAGGSLTMVATATDPVVCQWAQ